jgi:hypothetical protein
MSLVGPRPPSSEFAGVRTAQRGKLAVTPGITCLWQVSGRSHITSFDEWAALDLRLHPRMESLAGLHDPAADDPGSAAGSRRLLADERHLDAGADAARPRVLGLPVDALTMGGAVERVAAGIASGRLHRVMVTNANKAWLAHRDAELRG